MGAGAHDRIDATDSQSELLSGWKEIADYLGRNPSTVKRWSAQGGMPVHRPQGSVARKGVPVYAFAHELDSWLRGTGRLDASAVPHEVSLENAAPEGGGEAAATQAPAATSPKNRRHLWISGALSGLVLLVGAGVVAWQNQNQRDTVVREADTIPAEARRLYLRGTYLWNRRTPQSIAEAIPAFKRALAIYPDYADAHSGLATAYSLARQYSDMSGFDAYPLAEAAARRAVELDPSNASAQSALAFVEFHWLWEVDEGLARFRHALELDPDAANSLMWYASSLILAGRANEALPFIERAKELDPQNSTILVIEAQAMFFSGDRQGAHALVASLVANDPSHAWAYDALYKFHLLEGDYASALENYARVGDLIQVPRYRQVADVGIAALQSGGVGAMGAAMAGLEIELFKKDEALAWDVARAYAMTGDAKNAVKWLGTSWERHEERLIGIWSDPAMRPIRNDTAYRQIVAQVGALIPE